MLGMVKEINSSISHNSYKTKESRKQINMGQCVEDVEPHNENSVQLLHF